VAYATGLPPANAFSARGIEMTPELWTHIQQLVSSSPGTISRPLSFVGALFPFKIAMSNAIFEKNLTMNGAILEDGCEFTDCTFKSGLGLQYVDFRNGPGVFRNCTVEGYLSASWAHTGKHIAFMSSKMQDVDARGLSGTFQLNACTVTGSCSFKDSNFDNLVLASTLFEADLDITNIEAASIQAAGVRLPTAPVPKIGPLTAKRIDFDSVQFGHRVDLTASADHIRFSGAAFPSGGRLKLGGGAVDLSRVTIGAPLAVIGDNTIAVTSIQNADAGSLTLSHLDLSTCHFHGAHGLEAIGLESTVRLRTPPRMRARRRCIADEALWRSERGTWRSADWKISPPPYESAWEAHQRANPKPYHEERRSASPAGVASVYRALRKSLEGRSNEPGAADFYYGEMEMRRRDKSTSRPERAIIWIYWAVAGYGLRASRAFAWLITAFLLGAFVMAEIGLKKRNDDPEDALVAAVEGLIPGVSSGMALTSWGRFIDVLLTVIGPILLGVAALAIRNRVKR